LKGSQVRQAPQLPVPQPAQAAREDLQAPQAPRKYLQD